MASLARKGPLHGREPWQGQGLHFADDARTGLLLLRGRTDEAIEQRIASLLGCRLPGRPIIVERGARARALKLAPWRWMIFVDRPAAAGLLRQLRDILADSPVVVSDVSDGHAHIRLEGPRATDLLAAGTAVDLHPGVFSTGHAVQTELARARCLIWRDDEVAWSLLVDVSAAEYVWTWLTTNAELTIAAHHHTGR